MGRWGGGAGRVGRCRERCDGAGARHTVGLPPHVLHPGHADEHWSTAGRQHGATQPLVTLSSLETTHTVPEEKQRTIFSLSSKDDLKLHQSPAATLHSHLSFSSDSSSPPAPFLMANQRAFFVTLYRWGLSQTIPESALLILAGQGHLRSPSRPARPRA